MSIDSVALKDMLEWLKAKAFDAGVAVLEGYSAFAGLVRDHLADSGLVLGETAVDFVIGVALLLMLWGSVRLIRVLRSDRSGPHHESLHEATLYPRWLGLAAAVLFMAVLGAWSALAPLASASLALGVISPDGYRKTIQHLEGGIIRTIHVREGDVVKSGSPLIVLDDTQAKALDAALRERLLHLSAMEARLEAERTDAPAVSFPALHAFGSSQALQQVLASQRQLFSSRRAAYEGRTQVLEARIRQLDERNIGLREMISAEEEQISLIEEEIESAQHLLKTGLERKPRVLALRRARADVVALRASNRAKIAENEQAIGETRLQLLAIGEERQEKIGAELAEVRRTIAELKGQLPSREDILQRTVIRAPIDGTVMNLRVNTETGVVAPGQPLLDIVPDKGKLIIDARVRPTDVDRIKPSMSARVVLTAYRQRNLPLIHGRLRSISADALSDERTGASYFLAKVEVLPEDLKGLGDVKLVPGMPAEVMLMDGEQTLFAYLADPILESARRGLREK
ncbi:HlyD family type I secretion periplasmic adaptor subunit [Aestuariivirga sp.]|uniref:HlyD family type I secretion periplasmic adaptor subunit n=1 Tax=Aestuariivirga sp. TaxID=2650926 RepID=UPI00391B63B8